MTNMENYRVKLIWLSLGIFLLLLLCAKAETENPLANVNLSPFWQWRSAWECMQNVSKDCKSPKDTLTLDGVVNVSSTEIQEYCNGGCAQHTKYVLACISYVKWDFWFANGARVKNITDSITIGCDNNSTINTNFKSSAARKYQSLFVPLVASLATLVIVNMINM